MASNEIEVLDTAAPVETLNTIAAGRTPNRRRFLAALGMTGAVAGAGLISGCSTSKSAIVTTGATTQTNGIAQTGALNFLLNLKYLQATFYSYITQGTDLPSSATFGSGFVNNVPTKLVFSGTNAAQITDMLNEIYFDEVGHVSALRGLLGSSAIFRPALNLAAFGAITAINALSIARLLEDVTVTAFAGVASELSNSNLTFAAQIFGADTFHSGALRLVSIQNPTIAADIAAGDAMDVPPLDPGTATAAAAGPTGAGGFFATAGTGNATTTEPAGFAFARTPSQVLAVLYATTPGTPVLPGTAKGGFFPSGVNGLTNTV